MRGEIGSLIRAASLGAATAQERVRTVFTDDFQTSRQWKMFLDRYIPAGNVLSLLNRVGSFWEMENFQALYIAAWIYHPVEKGSYMLKLESARQYANVREAYDRLMRSGELQPRISSHLSKKGASAHEGWNFLRGYKELLIQLEGEQGGSPYLFLKCEGHPMEGVVSTAKHVFSWGVKTVTGAGATASAALHDLATDSSNVELRAAENFGGAYKSLLKELKLEGKRVTVADVVDRLWSACGFRQGIPANVKGDTRLLGQFMLGPQGCIRVFELQRDQLRRNKINFTPDAAQELRKLAERMTSASVSHPNQHYHEIRMTAADLNTALAVFDRYTN